jgi:hypothetical protein
MSESVQHVCGLQLEQHEPDLLQRGLLGDLPEGVSAEQRLHRQDLLQAAHLDEPGRAPAHLQGVAELLGHADLHHVRAVPVQWLPLPRMRCRGRGGVLLDQFDLFVLHMRRHLRLQQRSLRGVHGGDGRSLYGHADLRDMRELPDRLLQQQLVYLLPGVHGVRGELHGHGFLQLF